MKVRVVSSSNLEGRMDAGFNILMEEHRAAYEELFERYTLEELRDLAVTLPFDRQACAAVVPLVRRVSGPAEFAAWVGRQCVAGAKTPSGLERRLKKNLAVYCAAASQFSYARMLEAVAEIEKTQRALVGKFASVTATAQKKDCEAVLEAIRRDPGKKV